MIKILLGDFVYFFKLFFLVLVLAKIFLTIYRIATKQWLPSVHYLWHLIDWQVEAKKILILALFAFCLSLIKFLIQS